MITLFDGKSLGKTKIYTIMGEPVPLARVRLGRRPYSRVYDSQKTIKMLMKIGLENQHNEEPLFKGPLYVDLCFYMRMPQSTAPKRAKLEGTWHISRPDVDNLTKMYLDVATGIIYHDDSIVAAMSIRKVYSVEPKTIMTVAELK